MSSHSPEPWRSDVGVNSPDVVDAKGNAVSLETNAPRIVACVNAMKGIENPGRYRIIADAALAGFGQTTVDGRCRPDRDRLIYQQLEKEAIDRGWIDKPITDEEILVH